MDIPFFKPQISEAAVEAVGEALRSGWLTTGRLTEQFEKDFAEYVGASHAIMVNSCTAALHIALASLELKEGDEVITTPYTFAATAEVIEYFRAIPVLVDVREDTLNIDEQKIEAAVTSRTRAIIPVHYGGHPCEMDEIQNIAHRYGLAVVEDAAHCTPAYYRGKSIGSISYATCFSFYANKCITTGEGGMITTHDGNLAGLAKILRLHGLSKDAINRFQTGAGWKYDIVRTGFKYNPTDIASALGIQQLQEADSFYRRRREIAKIYRCRLQNNSQWILPTELDHVESSWHLMPVRLKKPETRDRVIEELNKKRIGASVHYIPLHAHSHYRETYGYEPLDFPNAWRAYQATLSLPIYPGLTNEEVKYICKSLHELAG